MWITNPEIVILKEFMDTNDSSSVYEISQFNSNSSGSIPLAVTFSAITAFTALGNLLVIFAVLLVHKLRCPSNFLIVSLAASDLLVSIMVMPFGTYLEYRQYWGLGEVACDIYIVFDVLLCTASILNLCAISIDRYLSVTRPFDYVNKRTPKRMLVMIVIAWVTSALISIPPTFGFKDKFVPGKCAYSKNFIYQIYACFGAFYIPLFVMLTLYGRIVVLARRIVKSDRSRLTSSAGDERQNPTQNHVLPQESDENICTKNSGSSISLYKKISCFSKKHRGSVTSIEKSPGNNLYTSVSQSHSNNVAPVVNIIDAQDKPEQGSPALPEGRYSSAPIHHFSRLPPFQARQHNVPMDELDNGSGHFLSADNFPASSSHPPQSPLTRQHRRSLHPGGSNARIRLPSPRDRASSVSIAHIQTNDAKSSLPFFSKQRLSIALHLRRSAVRRSNETKAIRTLGVIMGVFCICWLPFFIVAVS
ncbi:unnamed protein product [Mesocestoides corti]|uniref:G-protein coupled receptors family 1 profile domain-containing protein n=1 Tax=Mesocestoides corti TaxID=53468 RepID=A0A3P6GMM0_MESCO|nr:unnamed protein product [Mesocestoides corti]